MGNIPNNNNKNQKVKPKKLTKMQVEIACLKVKAHLQLVKDRKVNQLMKDEKALVAMINAKSRNKIEQTLQAQKVISDLKYIQACTNLMAYANTLKNNCAIIAESQGNPLALKDLIPYILSIVYAANHLGLSSLNEFKMLMLNYFGTQNVQLPMDQVDPKIIEAFKVNSNPLQLNTYFLQMAERNNIPLQQINVTGHNVTQHYTGPGYNPQNTIPQKIQPQQQHIYGGNPYRNSVNLDPYANNNQNQNQFQNNMNHNTQNNNAPQNNFSYPTQEFNPYQNKAFEFDNNPINLPSYNPNQNYQINNELANNFNYIAPVSVKPKQPEAFVPAPKAFENDPYANLLNINEIDDIPLYPQMQRISVDPNKLKNKTDPMRNTVTLNPSKLAPGGFSADYNPNYSPEYVPFKPDYDPPKNVSSNYYADTGFKQLAKPHFLDDNFKLNQEVNPVPANNPFPNYEPYQNLNDPGFDKICEQIRKGL